MKKSAKCDKSFFVDACLPQFIIYDIMGVIWILQRNQNSHNMQILFYQWNLYTHITGMLLDIHGLKVWNLVIFDHCCFLSLESDCEGEVVKN